MLLEVRSGIMETLSHKLIWKSGIFYASTFAILTMGTSNLLYMVGIGIVEDLEYSFIHALNLYNLQLLSCHVRFIT